MVDLVLVLVSPPMPPHHENPNFLDDTNPPYKKQQHVADTWNGLSFWGWGCVMMQTIK